MSDTVNHPDHYTAGGIEAIDVIEAYGLDFHLGNAVKYILRAGRKTDSPVEDLEKAIWYINRFLDTKVYYSITQKGKAVAALLKEGIDVPLVKNLGYKENGGILWYLLEDGSWQYDEYSRTTSEIIDWFKAVGGEFIDLDDLEKEEEPSLRQRIIEGLRQAGHFVPEGEELFYVNAEGSAWKLEDNGRWSGRVIDLSTEDVKRYLVCDGADVRGTLRTSNKGFRTLREVLNFPEEGDRIEDVDGDVWEYNGLSWIFEDLGKSTEQVIKYHGPVSLPDEEV